MAEAKPLAAFGTNPDTPWGHRGAGSQFSGLYHIVSYCLFNGCGSGAGFEKGTLAGEDGSGGVVLFLDLARWAPAATCAA